MKRNLLKNNGVQSLLASLLCIVLGLFLGYVVLLIINPAGAGEAILTVIKNFLTYNKPASQLKYLGNTLVKTAPLLMCALAILFAYKVGLFNIGAARPVLLRRGAVPVCGAGSQVELASVYAAGHSGRRGSGRHFRRAEILLQRQ